MIEYLLLFKSIHIIAAVGWFGGMFLLVRIFVYHVEAFDKPQPDQDILINQYKIIESRVYRIICTPGMVLTWIFGCLMIAAYIDAQGMAWFKANTWLHAKLLFVFLLSGYQGSCKTMMKKLAKGERVMTSFNTRLFNEVPTIFLLIIVLLAVYRNTLNSVYALIGIIAFTITLIVLAKWYKSKRTS